LIKTNSGDSRTKLVKMSEGAQSPSPPNPCPSMRAVIPERPTLPSSAPPWTREGNSNLPLRGEEGVTKQQTNRQWQTVGMKPMASNTHPPPPPTSFAVKARGGDGAINNAVNVTSYNLCGLEGLGHFVLTELCTPALSRGVIFLQEHWLSPGKMAQLENFSPSYLTFGVSGMEEKLSAGILRGRPFGGAAILVHSSLGAATTPLLVTERLNVVRIFNVLFINVYCPTRSLGNRAITASMLGEIETVLGMCKDCEVVMGGTSTWISGMSPLTPNKL